MRPHTVSLDLVHVTQMYKNKKKTPIFVILFPAKSAFIPQSGHKQAAENGLGN